MKRKKKKIWRKKEARSFFPFHSFFYFFPFLMSKHENKIRFFERKQSYTYIVGDEEITRTFQDGMTIITNWEDGKPYGKCQIMLDGCTLVVHFDATTGTYIGEPQIIHIRSSDMLKISEIINSALSYYNSSLSKIKIQPNVKKEKAEEETKKKEGEDEIASKSSSDIFFIDTTPTLDEESSSGSSGREKRVRIYEDGEILELEGNDEIPKNLCYKCGKFYASNFLFGKKYICVRCEEHMKFFATAKAFGIKDDILKMKKIGLSVAKILLSESELEKHFGTECFTTKPGNKIRIIYDSSSDERKYGKFIIYSLKSPSYHNPKTPTIHICFFQKKDSDILSLKLSWHFTHPDYMYMMNRYTLNKYL